MKILNQVHMANLQEEETLVDITVFKIEIEQLWNRLESPDKPSGRSIIKYSGVLHFLHSLNA